MRKVISCLLILIVQLLSCSTFGAILSQSDIDENKEEISEVIDSSTISDGSDFESEDETNVDIEGTKIPYEKQSKGFSILGLVGVILGMVSLGVGVYAVFILRKDRESLVDQISSCEAAIEKLRIKGENENFNDKVRTIEAELQLLRREFEVNDKMIKDLTQSTVISAKKNDAISCPQTQRSHINEKPARKFDFQTTYVSALSMDDEGSLTIPIWSLEPENKEALFRLKMDNSKGVGYYELNPNVKNLVPLMDMLKAYADGVTPSKNFGYETIAPGNLQRVGQDLKVLTKLIVG